LSTEFIYGLFIEFGGKKAYFYVGRSGRGELRLPGVRYKEHQYHATYDTTPVYAFIREELNDWNIPWQEEILCWCSKDEATTNDTEFYWVQKLIGEGHELKNAKNGDAKKYAEAKIASDSGYVINSPKDVAGYKTFRKSQILAEKQSLLQAKKTTSENGCLDAKIDRNRLFSAIKSVKSEPQKTVDTITDGQAAFNAGKYQIALNYVGGSYRRFHETYGESYYDCV